MDSRIVPRGFLSLSRLPRPVGWRRSLAKCVRARRGFATMDGVGNENAPTPRKNGIGIQMISHYLHSTLFPSHKPTQKPWQLALAQQHLSTHNLLNKALDVTPDPNIDLPPLVGADMKEHIRVLGEEQAAGYLRLAEGFMREGLPPLPETWRQGPKAEGWVRYDTRKKSYVTKSVPYPDDDALVFDTEVLYKIGGFPVIAVAASSRYWYAWTTPGLFSGKDPENFVPRTLIPLGPHDRKRIVVGHHVAYDRARILEEYRLEGTEFGFVDTLSMHSAVGGLSTQQRPAWIMRKQQDRIAKLQQGDLDGASGEVGGGDGGKAEGTAEGKRRKKDVGEAGEAPQSVDGGKEAEAKKEPRPSTTRPGVLKPTGPDMPTLEEFQEPGTTTTSWEDVSSLNNMGHIAELYLGEQVDKSVRKDFETTDPRTVIDNFQELMSYCAKDVDVTHRLFKAIMPRFRAKCPHPASFAGMLHMGKGYLPISDDWNKYVRDSEAKFQEFHQDIHVRLTRLVDEAVEKGKDGSWKSDPWLSQLDWTIQEAKFTKAGKPARQQGLPGKPKWYSDLWDKKTGSLNISLRTRITPYLLALQWKKYPLYYISAFGWTYVVPKGEVVDGGQDTQRLRFSDKPGERTYDPRASHDTTHDYFRVPHPGGDGANCGSPLSKSFMTAFENGTLTSTYEGARHILSLSSQCTYWLSAKQRVNSQFVIWERDLKGLPGGVPKMPEGKGYGVILPQSITMGTVTRRAVEGTWMTAANAKKNRIGTELKCQVQAPPGYKMVGADVDSEELWIASLLGDAQFNMHGATAIGFMTLQGSKVNKTDLHTVTGNILGTSRDNAKVFNYSRIYGAGIKYAVQLLLQASPGLAKDVALQKAEQLYRSTKGLRSKGRQIWEVDDAKTSVQYYHGGTESFMFNQLERIGTSRRPKTPVLGCEIPSSLMPEFVGPHYMTSRVNWAVQSSGVDYLHLVLVSMSYLTRRLNISTRFMLSIHDEVRFLVKDEHAMLAALCLQISNLWVRAIFAESVGIRDLPSSVAFFSSVDVDHVLRKEVDMDCVTPSNTVPVAPGKSVDVFKVVEEVEEWKRVNGVTGSLWAGKEVPGVLAVQKRVLEDKFRQEREREALKQKLGPRFATLVTGDATKKREGSDADETHLRFLQAKEAMDSARIRLQMAATKDEAEEELQTYYNRVKAVASFTKGPRPKIERNPRTGPGVEVVEKEEAGGDARKGSLTGGGERKGETVGTAGKRAVERKLETSANSTQTRDVVAKWKAAQATQSSSSSTQPPLASAPPKSTKYARKAKAREVRLTEKDAEFVEPQVEPPRHRQRGERAPAQTGNAVKEDTASLYGSAFDSISPAVEPTPPAEAPAPKDPNNFAWVLDQTTKNEVRQKEDKAEKVEEIKNKTYGKQKSSSKPTDDDDIGPGHVIFSNPRIDDWDGNGRKYRYREGDHHRGIRIIPPGGTGQFMSRLR